MVDYNSANEYLRALRLGQKEVSEREKKGLDPFPAVLDTLLPEGNAGTIRQLPIQEIPISRIVGTKSAGRLSALSAGFYPLLGPESEFAVKWQALCTAHLSDTGIRDAILCYEYLGSFYVQEGNKRVSVLKYFGASRIAAEVRRILPPADDSPRIRAYYEFLDFYRVSGMYDIQFRRPGDYAKLLAALGKTADEPWQESERRAFFARFHRFCGIFDALNSGDAELLPEEALLLWLRLYPFSKMNDMSDQALKQSLSTLWSDILTDTGREPTRMQTAPEEASKTVLEKLIPNTPTHLNVAMIHQSDPDQSNWTRGHEQGAKELAQTMGEQATIRSYFHADTPELTQALLRKAVEEGAELVFTTTPLLLRETLKAAIAFPKVRFLNCSLDSRLSSVRSYYCRIFEGKFITGAIAGALAQNDLIGYIGSYPILGVPASINAFALGAQMTNPRARILLDWSCLPGNAVERLQDKGVQLISNRDIPLQDRRYLAHGEFGTFLFDEQGSLRPLASPCWLWGRLYEHVVRTVLSGKWNKTGSGAISYWWGMDAGVIDVELTKLVPEGVRTLAGILREELCAGRLDPFRRQITAQDGTKINSGETGLAPETLLHIDWLCENIDGSFPAFEELDPASQPLVRELGIYADRIPPERETEP